MIHQAAAHDASAEPTERRRHHRVREIFEEACELIEPFFAKENRWGNNTLDHLAYRVVREQFPQLTIEEVRILVVACRRIYGKSEGAEAAGRP